MVATLACSLFINLVSNVMLSMGPGEYWMGTTFELHWYWMGPACVLTVKGVHAVCMLRVRCNIVLHLEGAT